MKKKLTLIIVASLLMIIMSVAVISSVLITTEDDPERYMYSELVNSRDRNIGYYTYYQVDDEYRIEPTYYDFEDTEILIKDFENYYENQENLIYTMAEYMIKVFDYSPELHDPNIAWEKRKGSCQSLTHIYRELLKHYGIEYYVLTGELYDVAHTWTVINLDSKWYMSDMSMAVSESDVKYAKFGYTSDYSIDMVPVEIQPYREWYYGDKNIYADVLYSIEFDTLWRYVDGMRYQVAEDVEDVWEIGDGLIGYVTLDGEEYAQIEGKEFRKVD